MLTHRITYPLQLLLLLMTSLASGQNLVPNSGFETYTSCPVGLGQINFAAPWESPTQGSPDYFNECSGPTVGVPVNWVGYQPAFAGEGYAGCYLRADPDYREYIQIQLTTPLQDEACYTVGFYINLSNEHCGVTQVGAHLSPTAPSHNGVGVLNVVPQIVGDGSFNSDTVNWVLITGQYEAQGGEAYITIGNFSNNANTPTDPSCNLSVHSYYYIDNVFVIENTPTGEIAIDFENPVEACYEYTIDPELGDVAYLWEDGSRFPTLTVTQSGTYSLTVYSDCARGIDSIEVTILGSDPVSFDPAFISMCQGESFVVSLDPDAGDYTWQDGSTDHEYVITTPGDFSVTLDDGCEVSADEITVEVIIPPGPIDLGPDATLCLGDQLSFSFDPDIGEYTWQDGSTESTYTIEEPGLYTVTINNACGTVSDEIIVEYIDIPEVDLGPPITFVCPGDVLELSFDPSLGDFIWNDGSTDAEYFVSVSGTYSVTITNNCGSSTDAIDVIQPVQPVVDLPDSVQLCNDALPYMLSIGQPALGDVIAWSTGASSPGITIVNEGRYRVTVTNPCFVEVDEVYVDISNGLPSFSMPAAPSLCSGDQIILNATSPDASYAWFDGTTLPVYVVTTPGTYTVTVANYCGTVVDSAVVTSADADIQPVLGPDFALCPGEQVILSAGIDNVSYAWNDLSTADTLVVTTAGTYSVTVQGTCGTAADTIVVTLDGSPPVLALPASITLCTGDSITLETTISGVTYLWSDGSVGSSLSITSPGTYMLTVSNSCGADSDTTVIADGGPPPFVDLGNDIVLCAGDTIIVYPEQQAVDAWMWNNGSIADTFLVMDAGLISVQVSNGCGNAVDTLLVTALSIPPTLDLGNDTVICQGEILSLDIAVPDVSITWSDGSQQPSFEIYAAGQYFATIENICGSLSDTIGVAQLSSPVLDLGADQTLCPGEWFVIDPGIDEVAYLWQDGSTNSTFATTLPGEYSLTITNVCGSAYDSLLIIESTSGPQVDLGNDIYGCAGDTITINAGISGVAFSWHDGSTQHEFIALQSGLVVLQVSNNCGMDTDSVLIDLSGIAPATLLGNDTTLCEGNTLVLVSLAPADAAVTWQDGSGERIFTVTTTGLYYLHEVNMCGENRDSIVVNFTQPPLPFSLGPDTALCPGESILLIAPPTMDSLAWQNGNADTFFLADLAQVYSLHISNACGMVSDSIELTYVEETFVRLPDTIVVCPGDLITLDASQDFPAAYVWSTGATTSVIQVDAPGSYIVTISTSCFSKEAETHVITDVDCGSRVPYSIPNIFSPNGDQINDVFGIHFSKDVEVKAVIGDIFDRWGNLIFRSAQHPFIWDGTYGGKPLHQGIYIYRLTLTYSNGINTVTEIIAGDITLMR